MLLKQSFIEKIYRQLGFRKSNLESNFESLKAEVLSILKKQAKKEHNEIKKALREVDNYFYFEKTLDGRIIQKSGYPVGTVREWKGKKYIKVAPKMWKRKYDKNDRGTSISAGILIKKVEQCKTVEDLMQLVLANKQRFLGENGRPLPIVDKIRAAVDKKNESFDSETKTVKTPKIEVSESDKKMYYNNASYKYAEIMSSKKIKDIKEGYSKLEDFIQRKKDLFESNKKDIEAGKDSNNKLKTYNAHYEIEIAEYEKIANKVKEYIDSKSKKKESPKTEKKEMSEKPKETISELKQRKPESKDSKEDVSENSQTTNLKTSLSDVRKKYETSKSVQGNKKTVTLPNGEKIKCHYKLVEADAPTASHDEKTFAKTDGFPTNKDGSTINDRDYAQDKDAQMSVIEIANKYGSQALENPPIVTKDGIVLSGNNRTMSSKLAAKNGTDKAYLDDLKEQIDEFGIDEDELKGFKHPRIILEIDEEHKGDYTTQEMAKYNETGMKTQNTTEKAVKMAKTLTNDSISDIAQSISEYNTLGELYNDENAVEDFIGKLVKNGILTNQNKAEYVSDGKLSDAGKEFVETVLCGTILNESNIRQMNSEGGKLIRKKLIRALMPLAQNKGNGNEYSINDELNQAVEIALRVAKNHKEFPNVQAYMQTQDMFDSSKTSELVTKFAEYVHDLGEKNFADKMKSLQAGLRESASGEQDIFFGGCETKEQVLNRVFELKKSIQNILNSLFNRS